MGQAPEQRHTGSLAGPAFQGGMDCKRAGQWLMNAGCIAALGRRPKLHIPDRLLLSRLPADHLMSKSQIRSMQILGEEARSRVPAGFLVQNPDVANPPTLFLPLADMAQRVAKSGVESDADLQEELTFLRAGAHSLEVRQHARTLQLGNCSRAEQSSIVSLDTY